MSARDIQAALKRFFETARPDLDHYRKTPRLAKVTAVHETEPRVVDVTILRNDGSADDREPPIPKAPLATGGLIPMVGAQVIVDYLRGDPGAPVITGVVDLGPADLHEIRFRQEDGARITVTPDGDHEAVYVNTFKYIKG